MKRAILISVFLGSVCLCGTPLLCRAQAYVKLNALYALAGVVNPQFELRLSQHATFQTELVYSPWRSVRLDGKSKPMHFGIFLNECRYYFRGHNRGWYVGGNAGMMAFRMSKLYWKRGRIRLEDRYCKGYGFMIGLCAGYEYVFRERWVLDAFFGWAWMDSQYNGYSLDGEVDLHPHRPVESAYADPFNGSSEWLPNKIGLSIGVRIFDPAKRRTVRRRTLAGDA